MGLLDQLKSQATEIKSQRIGIERDLLANTAQTEAACSIAIPYLRELAKHLTVLEPNGPRYSLDGKTPWPAMKLIKFNADSRKKVLRDKEVVDTVSIGWTIIPKMGVPVGGAVTLTFLPQVDQVQQILNHAHIEHNRQEQRHPERKNLQSVRFEYTTQAKGNITVTADHDAAQLVFRLANVNGFGLVTHVIDAARINSDLLDELAKLIMAQESAFA